MTTLHVDEQAILVAVRMRLIGDAPLAATLEHMDGVPGVYRPVVPPEVDWTGVNLVYGIQANTRDIDANGYGQRGVDLRLRVVAQMKGPEPGKGEFPPLYAALALARAALTDTPLVVSDHVPWYLEWVDAVPETAPPDDDGYLRLQAGDIYQVRVYR